MEEWELKESDGIEPNVQIEEFGSSVVTVGCGNPRRTRQRRPVLNLDDKKSSAHHRGPSSGGKVIC